LDLNPASGTEEAANSVYAKLDGTRHICLQTANIHNGIPDSDQFYIIDTSNKAILNFYLLGLQRSRTTLCKYAQTGYYNGDSTNIELYPDSFNSMNGRAQSLSSRWYSQ